MNAEDINTGDNVDGRHEHMKHEHMRHEHTQHKHGMRVSCTTLCEGCGGWVLTYCWMVLGWSKPRTLSLSITALSWALRAWGDRGGQPHDQSVDLNLL